MSTDTETFAIPVDVAWAYEHRFVPAIFAHWAPVTLEAAGVTGPVAEGTTLLDVGCGTGIVARTASALTESTLDIVAVDLNPAMLTVARQTADLEGHTSIEWREGDAAALPLPDGAVDVAVSQMAAMFFPDPIAAYAEMARVTRPGGRLAWVVPAGLDEQPAYGPFVDAAAEHIDPDGRHLLEGVYWNRGDRQALAADLESVGLEVTDVRARAGEARFASVADFVDVEIGSTPLADRIGTDVRIELATELGERLPHFVGDDGSFEIPLVCNVIAARVPA